MRILRCLRSVNPSGGGPIEGVKQVSRSHLNQGHHVEVVSLDDPVASWVKEFSFKVHALGPVRSNYGYSPKLVSWLRREAPRFDAVIVGGLWQYQGLGTWRALRAADTPYFVLPHGMLDPWFKRTYPLKHLKKWLYWPWAEYRVLRDARAVLFTCEEERRLARRSFWLYKCKERVVNYGTAAPTGDPGQQKAAFFERFPHLRDKRIILFLSRIHEKKGCDNLIKAFARLLTSDLRSLASAPRSLHLLIVGPCAQPAYLAKLKTLAGNLGLLTSDLRPPTSAPYPPSSVTFSDMLTGDIKWGAFRSAEVFSLPSHQENFGIAVVEALACGTPVLISNQVNIWREIEQDGAGLVANDDDEGSLQLLTRWLELGEANQSAMRARARQCFADRFQIHRAAQSLINTLRECGVKW